MPGTDYLSGFADVLSGTKREEVPDPADITREAARPEAPPEPVRPPAGPLPTASEAQAEDAAAAQAGRQEQVTLPPPFTDAEKAARLERLKQRVKPKVSRRDACSDRTVRVDLPQELVEAVMAQMAGARNRTVGVGAYLYLHLSIDREVAIPAEIAEFAQGFHVDGGMDGLIEIMSDVRDDLRRMSSKLSGLSGNDLELAQLLAWLVLERKDMLESRNGPVEHMDFQDVDITRVLAKTHTDAVSRAQKARRAEGIQIDKRRGSRT